MAYATQDDIVALYSRDALAVADRDGDGEIDADAVARALAEAAGEIDALIAVRYALPLAAVPDVLRRVACDIALYRLALSRDVATEEHRRRYEDALTFLGKVVKGHAALPGAGGATGEPDMGAAPQPIVTKGPERQFSRDKMQGL
jgi:phage gp36-like protein